MISSITKHICFRDVLVLFCIFVTIVMITFIFITYILFQYLKISLEKVRLMYKDYHKPTKLLLKKYGKYPIQKIYLCRRPCHTLVQKMLYFASFDSELMKQNYLPYHSSFIIEINTEQGVQFLLLEKANKIQIEDHFTIYSKQALREIDIYKTGKKYTLEKILKKTKKRVGEKVFFNWEFYNNTCQTFVKEILKTIGKYDSEYISFCMQDSLMNHIAPSTFSLHIVNCTMFFYDILDVCLLQYIYR